MSPEPQRKSKFHTFDMVVKELCSLMRTRSRSSRDAAAGSEDMVSMQVWDFGSAFVMGMQWQASRYTPWAWSGKCIYSCHSTQLHTHMQFRSISIRS